MHSIYFVFAATFKLCNTLFYKVKVKLSRLLEIRLTYSDLDQCLSHNTLYSLPNRKVMAY